MKTLQTLLLISALLWAGPAAMAQEDNILGAIMEAAAAQENAGNQAQSAADNAAQSEAAAAWQAEWEEMMEENGKLMDALETKYLKCTAMMVMYLGTYLYLVDNHTLLDQVTMSECDALGMQTLMMASSTTIMYCPEEMSNLSDDDLKSIAIDFDNKFSEYGWTPESTNTHLFWQLLQLIKGNFYSQVRNQDDTDLSVYANSPDEWVHIMKYMIEFFRPRYIIPRTLEIGQKMETLGCSKPN